MARGEKKQSKPLVPPLVPDAELAKARAALQHDDNLRRARSNMSYWLEQNGQRDEFRSWPSTDKRALLEKVTRNAEAKAQQGISHTHHTKDNFKWLNKHNLIKAFGKEAAEHKISSNSLTTRADRDTRLSGEWDVEYKIYGDTGGANDSDSFTNTTSAKRKLETVDELNAAQDSMGSMSDSMI